MGWFSSALSSITGADLLGGAISLVSSLFGTSKSEATARDINRANLAFQREFAQNGIQWKVNDMRAAGLNPLLSTGINATSPAGGSSVMPDYSGISSSGRDVARIIAEKTAERANADINTAKAVAENNRAQAESAKATAIATMANSAANVKHLDTLDSKLRAETSQIPTLTPFEVNQEAKRKNATWIENLGRGGVSGFAELFSGLSALAERQNSSYTVEKATKEAEKTTNSGGARQSTGRSVLY